jgi:serine phosphatase RsbU (regulator of sigma subunit)
VKRTEVRRTVPIAIEAATAKTNKYASRDSGDTVEVVERPSGGISVIMVDGQGSGEAAKSLSMLLTSKAVSLLKEGVRDGAVARAVHDSLYTFRKGKVSASLDILSVDLATRTVIATRNGTTPLILVQGEDVRVVTQCSAPIGLYHFTKPIVTQVELAVGLLMIVFSDGVAGAGRRAVQAPFDIPVYIKERKLMSASAETIADDLLTEAVKRDEGRPRDDMAVVVLGLREHSEEPLVRRLEVRVPLP